MRTKKTKTNKQEGEHSFNVSLINKRTVTCVTTFDLIRPDHLDACDLYPHNHWHKNIREVDIINLQPSVFVMIPEISDPRHFCFVEHILSHKNVEFITSCLHSTFPRPSFVSPRSLVFTWLKLMWGVFRSCVLIYSRFLRSNHIQPPSFTPQFHGTDSNIFMNINMTRNSFCFDNFFFLESLRRIPDRCT